MTLDQTSALSTQLKLAAFDGLSAADCLALLHTADTPNPVPQGTGLRQLVKREVLGLLSVESQAKVLNFSNLSLIYVAFDNQDHDSAVVWCYSLETVAAITPAERDICVAFIMTPVPDPSWSAMISWVQATGINPTETDVAAARLYDRAQAKQNEVTAARDALSAMEHVLAQLRQGIDPEVQ